MEVSEIEQTTQDIDWFAVDAFGAVAHFASGGKLLPKSVTQSKDDLEKIRVYFRSLPDERTPIEVDSLLRQMVDLPDENAEKQYLSDFSSMSGRGLYSYDSPLAGDRSSYFRVTFPDSPLTIRDLPNEIASIVAKTNYSGEFASTQSIRDHEII